MPQNHSIEQLMAEKDQQEANRARRLLELYTPEQLWERQQASLTELEKLRPDSHTPRDRRRSQVLQEGSQSS